MATFIGLIMNSKCQQTLDENEDVNEMIEELAKRYGEIMLPEYDEDKQLTFSEQFGLVVLDK